MMKHIICMGGGGFSMEPENLAMDHYVLEQSRSPHPKICFLPTASGDAQSYVERFYATFKPLDCEPSHLSLFDVHTSNLDKYLLEQDIIYVGGGNTRNMLVLWREWGLDEILHAAWEQGVVLAGVSAGAICWFEQGLTDSVPGKLLPLECLGYLPGSCSPHYDNEADRRPIFKQLIATGHLKPGYGIDDGAALHSINGDIHRVVSTRPGATAHFVEANNGQVREEPLKYYVLKTIPAKESTS